jgi:pyrimidine deaminase RibD-like protein/NTP pyrophosphatase (non-canonical NTP hydrolase)
MAEDNEALQADRLYTRLALDEARKCTAEDDRTHPFVGAVAIRGTELLGTAYRGELKPGEHAEYTLLEQKLPEERLSGATVYTTLEPCTSRTHPKVPCAERLLERGVARVVIGMLDPNPEIRGKGVLRLREARIAVDFFSQDQMMEIEELNREFIRSKRRAVAAPLSEDLKNNPPPVRSLDDWYVSVNKVYWNRNFHLSPSAVLAHLVEVIGGLSGVASRKRKPGVDLDQYVAKAIAWWLSLSGKLGVRSVEAMIWDKFPDVCAYCHQQKCLGDECRQLKQTKAGPDWDLLASIASENERPATLGTWQVMFGRIYPPTQVQSSGAVFARLAEELGELAESVRVFSAEPGYFLSEAADVFAWLMQLRNSLDAEVNILLKNRGGQLEETMWRLYPDSCTDCGQRLCACPPILASTIGRIAHEVPSGRGGFGGGGRFVTPDKARKLFSL